MVTKKQNWSQPKFLIFVFTDSLSQIYQIDTETCHTTGGGDRDYDRSKCQQFRTLAKSSCWHTQLVAGSSGMGSLASWELPELPCRRMQYLLNRSREKKVLIWGLCFYCQTQRTMKLLFRTQTKKSLAAWMRSHQQCSTVGTREENAKIFPSVFLLI